MVTSEGQEKQSFPGNCWLGKSDAGDFDGMFDTGQVFVNAVACTATCLTSCMLHDVDSADNLHTDCTEGECF